jgi:hypothetical protein
MDDKRVAGQHRQLVDRRDFVSLTLGAAAGVAGAANAAAAGTAVSGAAGDWHNTLIQNAAMIGTNAARVDIFANLGVRVVQLTGHMGVRRMLTQPDSPLLRM